MSELKHRFVQSNGIRMHIAEQGVGPLENTGRTAIYLDRSDARLPDATGKGRPTAETLPLIG